MNITNNSLRNVKQSMKKTGTNPTIFICAILTTIDDRTTINHEVVVKID